MLARIRCGEKAYSVDSGALTSYCLQDILWAKSEARRIVQAAERSCGAMDKGRSIPTKVADGMSPLGHHQGLLTENIRSELGNADIYFQW